VWLQVEVAGHDATCHTGRRSCFYRKLRLSEGRVELEADGSEPLFDVAETYRNS
jgi:phosphoribosyl-AMP cyclohydrolase